MNIPRWSAIADFDGDIPTAHIVPLLHLAIVLLAFDRLFLLLLRDGVRILF